MRKEKIKIYFTESPRCFFMNTFSSMSFRIISAAVLSLILISQGPLSAEEKTEIKNRIIIYNFQMLKTEPEQVAKDKKPKNYGYYSIILPETISKKLKESDRFIIKRGRENLLNDEADSIDAIREKYTGQLSSAAKENSSDYIITGQYTVKDNILNVRIFIYNARLNVLEEAMTSEAETGLYLKDTPDSLSEDIDERIKDIIVEKIDKGGRSPFLIPATPLKYTSIGLDAGYVYMSGKWKDRYNNTQYYTPYITFDIASFLDITFKFDHFTTDTRDIYTSGFYKLNVMGGSALLGLKYQVFSNLSLYLTAGGGYNRSEFITDSGSPFTAPSEKERTTDPSAEAGLGIKINVSSLYIRSGFLYKRIYFDKEPMDLRVVYGGAGIHF